VIYIVEIESPNNTVYSEQEFKINILMKREGMSNEEIADRLDISRSALRTVQNNIRMKKERARWTLELEQELQRKQ
jgi:Bacterial regulatory proteins, luxR family.